MKNNTGIDNPIITILLKIKSSCLSLITRIKSLFQKKNSNNKNITTEVEDNQQRDSLEEQFDSLSIIGDELEIWYDAEGEFETKSEIDEEEEFFDALGNEENLTYGNGTDISEDEGYASSSSRDENIAAQNITIKNDQYYSINDFEKTISLSSYSNDTLALAFGGEAIGKITNAEHSLASLHYNEGTKFIQFVHNASNTKDSNLFVLNPNSFNIYMPSYFENNQSKSPKEAFGDSQVVILLQKPESVNLPPKGFINKSLWWIAEKWIKDDPIEIDDNFSFDFINFSCSNSASVIQFIDKKSPNAFMLSLIDDISSKQEKIDWNIKDILVRGNCISLTKELVDERVPNNLNNTNVEQISGNHRSCA
ncbi:MAG: hypothetical protein sL5_01130 [Candidatus Mesenet longicola]|uniref:Uncharacterized protein n=1 Tax=Candidatus Mesenet longicola TaxID=1892558 RepID=A0A8J3MNQ1_9RICK|nr:MAG: hypothetical protein sGL2_01230 [Candidatus Mesenet longicola]GHM59120.1 MAG: hypothetical protein sL5_01130 [Candidatus Mesenet longicola]